jgi:predicted metal-dependent hydrolase
MLSKMSHYHIGVPTVTIRVMRSRWGSCNARHKKICLNLRLVKASSECIDYVVMHELAHLIHANHSEAYYLLLSILMPDWKARKKKLNAETGISRW